MHVSFLTHYFPPEVGAPQARISALARALAARGMAVTVHTGAPHYPDGRIPPPYRNRLFARERDGDVTVVRSVVYPTPNRGVARRLVDHAVTAAGMVATAPLTPRADVVVAETPPLFTAAAGVAYARAKRAALVLNVADRWPESVVQLGALRRPRLIGAAEALEARCYRAARSIAVPTEGLAGALGRHPDALGRVVHVPPAVDLGAFDVEPVDADRRGPLRILYAGTVGLAQGVATLVRAVRLAGPDVAELTIAGSGAELPEVRREAAGLDGSVRLLGIVEHAEIPRLYREADVAAVLLRDRPVLAGALPTKLFEGMAAGRALVLSAGGEAARLVARHGCGVVVPPEDPAALAAALRALAADRERVAALGERARRAARAYGRDRLADRWERLLVEAVGHR